jgi:NAD(P)H-hydrate epimerase
MALRPLSRAEVRALDRRAIEEYGVPGMILMENAGSAAARWLVELGIAGPVLICCGKGNNGGDGYVIARQLESWGHDVRVALTCDPAELKGDALVNFHILQASATPVTIWNGTRDDPRLCELFNNADWVVDCLLGTGAQGTVRGPMRLAIEMINACGARKLAIDIPSGLDCDTGEPLGCAVRASHTATFVAAKLGFTKSEAAAYTGEIRVFDIGLPALLLNEFKI